MYTGKPSGRDHKLIMSQCNSFTGPLNMLNVGLRKFINFLSFVRANKT